MSAKGILYPVLNVNRERVVQTTKILLSQWRLMVEKETIFSKEFFVLLSIKNVIDFLLLWKVHGE